MAQWMATRRSAAAAMSQHAQPQTAGKAQCRPAPSNPPLSAADAGLQPSSQQAVRAVQSLQVTLVQASSRSTVAMPLRVGSHCETLISCKERVSPLMACPTHQQQWADCCGGLPLLSTAVTRLQQGHAPHICSMACMQPSYLRSRCAHTRLRPHVSAPLSCVHAACQ